MTSKLTVVKSRTEKERQDAHFCRSVIYFWTEKRDPTRYADWDADRCRLLMPAFYEAWRQRVVYTELLTAAGRAVLDTYRGVEEIE